MESKTEWAPSSKYPNHLAQTIQSGNCIVTIHRPILTEKERAKRMEEIKQAAVRLVLAAEKAKRQTKPTN